jgi:predicted nucleic acid-binding protein
MTLRFIDANIILRVLTQSDSAQAEASRSLLLRVEDGEEKVTTSPLVLFEIIFTLQSPRSYKLPKQRVVQLMLPLIELRGLQIPNKQLWFDAFAVWLEHPIDFTDAYNVAYMRATGISEIYAWDKDYDHVPDIKRVEPNESSADEAA